MNDVKPRKLAGEGILLNDRLIPVP